MLRYTVFIFQRIYLVELGKYIYIKNKQTTKKNNTRNPARKILGSEPEGRDKSRHMCTLLFMTY